MTFLDEVRAGRQRLVDVDDWISRWHEGAAGEGLELHAYLGMSQAQYASWLSTPRLLSVFARNESTLRPGQRPRVYVASRASVPARVAMWRELRAKGAAIVSSWIDAEESCLGGALDALWVRILQEVTAADRLVLFAEASDFPLKGAYVEVGMALALGKPVFVVCPGVVIEADSLRPLGSWAAHPLVRFSDSIEAAVFGEGTWRDD